MKKTTKKEQRIKTANNYVAKWEKFSKDVVAVNENFYKPFFGNINNKAYQFFTTENFMVCIETDFCISVPTICEHHLKEHCERIISDCLKNNTISLGKITKEYVLETIEEFKKDNNLTKRPTLYTKKTVFYEISHNTVNALFLLDIFELFNSWDLEVYQDKTNETLYRPILLKVPNTHSISLIMPIKRG